MNKLAYILLGVSIAFTFAFISTGGGFLIDDNTKTQVVEDYNHYEKHAGNHYTLCGGDTLASGDSLVFAVTTSTSAKRPHMAYLISHSNIVKFEMYEDASVTGGTAMTPENDDGDSGNTSLLTVVMNPTITDYGTSLPLGGDYGATQGNFAQGGSFDRGGERLLKTNSTTLYIIRSGANSNRVTGCGSWYEHTPAWK